MAIQKFQALENEIDRTGDILINQAHKRADTKETMIMELVYGLAAAIIGVAIAAASIAFFVANPYFIPVAKGIAAGSGVYGGSFSAILGTTGIICGIVDYIDQLYRESNQAEWAASGLPAFYKREIAELAYCLEDFRKSLPTEFTKFTKVEEAVEAAKYMDNIDKSKAKEIQDIKSKHDNYTIQR